MLWLIQHYPIDSRAVAAIEDHLQNLKADAYGGRTVDMNWVAWRILTGDKAKYLGMIVGVSFAALLIAQQATLFAPRERKILSFVLAQNKPNVSAMEVSRRIALQTSLQALTREEFVWTTIRYYLRQTGIPVNFGITVLLGFTVGTAIAGQTFYLFTVENRRQFATLKALGLSNRRVVSMVLLQAAIVGGVGYGLGVGAAAVFGQAVQNYAKLAFFMPWQVLVGTGVAVVLIVLVSSLLSIYRVLVLEPATVFS